MYCTNIPVDSNCFTFFSVFLSLWESHIVLVFFCFRWSRDLIFARICLHRSSHLSFARLTLNSNDATDNSQPRRPLTMTTVKWATVSTPHLINIHKIYNSFQREKQQQANERAVLSLELLREKKTDWIALTLTNKLLRYLWNIGVGARTKESFWIVAGARAHAAHKTDMENREKA